MRINARRSGLSVLLPTAGMEICRLYAVASLLFLIPGSPPYPFTGLACVLTAGTLLERGLSFVSRRRITSLLVYGIFCGLCIFLPVRSYSGYAFWLSVCAGVFFFFRGVQLGGKGISRSLTLTRYDTGIGVFFFVYFLRIFMGETDPLALRIIGAYFLFSILAMAASRCWEQDRKFAGSRPAMSLVIPFIAVFFLAASALVLLYPILTQAAGSVYGFLSDNSGPVLNFLVAIIRFLFAPRRGIRSDPSSSMQDGGQELIIAETSGPGILLKIIAVIFTVFGVALAAFLLIISVRALVCYLLGRKGPHDGEGLFASLRRLLCFLRSKLTAVLRFPGAFGLARQPLEGIAQEAFRKLCAWGRVSGLPRRSSETPAEYACRLGVWFSPVSGAADVLARALQEELYGKRTLTEKAGSQLKAAQRELANPALFPARLSCRLNLRRKKSITIR